MILAAAFSRRALHTRAATSSQHAPPPPTPHTSTAPPSSESFLTTRSFVVPTLTLRPSASALDVLARRVAVAPLFFRHAPLVVDLGAVGGEMPATELDIVVQRCSQLGLLLVGVTNASERMLDVLHSRRVPAVWPKQARHVTHGDPSSSPSLGSLPFTAPGADGSASAAAAVFRAHEATQARSDADVSRLRARARDASVSAASSAASARGPLTAALPAELAAAGTALPRTQYIDARPPAPVIPDEPEINRERVAGSLWAKHYAAKGGAEAAATVGAAALQQPAVTMSSSSSSSLSSSLSPSSSLSSSTRAEPRRPRAAEAHRTSTPVPQPQPEPEPFVVAVEPAEPFEVLRPELAAEQAELESGDEATGGTEGALRAPMVVNGSIRSGQQIYARDTDLVVLGNVASGAEAIADGSIHIYGSLKGRALAGLSGNRESRIFAARFEPELVCIAESFVVGDDLPSQAGVATVWLHDSVIHLHSPGSDTVSASAGNGSFVAQNN